MGARVGNTETNGDLVQKAWLRRRDASRGKVITDKKHNLVSACFDFLATQQRLIHPPIRVGAGAHDSPWGSRFERPQFNLHRLGRTAMHGIENMGGEFSSHNGFVQGWTISRKRQ